MNPDVKTAWVTALRSGDYTQCTGHLTKVDENGKKSHCCLGVLCDLAIKSGVVHVQAEVKAAHSGQKYLTYNGGPHYLPHEVRDWAGIEEGNPRVGSQFLADWNDEYGLDFSRIADLIEQYL